MTEPRAFTIDMGFEYAESPEEGFPAGAVHYTVLVVAEGRNLSAEVQAAYASINGRENPVAKSLAFDNDTVVVDFDKDDQLIGIEGLSRKGPEACPEFVDWAMKRVKEMDDAFPVVVAATLMTSWAVVEAITDMALDAAFAVLAASDESASTMKLQEAMKTTVRRRRTRSSMMRWKTRRAALASC